MADVPRTTRVPIVDVLHGEAIPDPYRWLEDPDSAETQEWVREQTAYTDRRMAGRPEVRAFHDRLTELLGGRTVQSAMERGGRVFFVARDPGQEQPTLRVRPWPDPADGAAAERVLVDANCLGAGHPLALDWWYPSPDGRLVVYGLSEDGSEESVLHVMDVGTGEDLPERISRTRYSGVAWDPDGRGFFYTRYPEPGEVPPGDEFYVRRVLHHRLGDDPARDRLIYVSPYPRTQQPHPVLSDDGRHLVLFVHEGWIRADVLLLDLKGGLPDGRPRPVIQGLDAVFAGEMRDGRLVLLTNHDAPHFRVVGVDPDHPEPENWVDLVRERPDFIIEDFVFAADGSLVLSGLQDAAARLFRVKPASAAGGGASAAAGEAAERTMEEISLPGLGTITALTGNPGREVMCTFDTFTQPPGLYRVDVARLRAEPWLLGEAPGADRAAVEVRQVLFASRDGTRVPMFILTPRGYVPDGHTPTLLTGYGGFSVARTPAFQAGALAWVERGGVYAVANLRGGNEYGEAWHRAGMLENKQNVFDDFIVASEYLLREGYTDRDHFGIYGRSNGGLLVGAALTQRPDLYRAVVCGVPLLDMLRYHRFLIGATWIPEYGSADDPEQFRFIRAYSPYHNVREGVAYPAVYFFAAMSDVRVDALHARKMTALLQHATASDPEERPVCLRLEFQAGHGVGKPLARVVAEQEEWWGFLAWQLGRS